MGKITKHAAILQKLLTNYEQPHNYPIETCLVSDKQRHHYQVLRMGWADKDTFILTIALHFQIKPDGKIWILANATEDDVEDMLLAQGVKKADIVLGLFPEYVRAYTGFATA
jgi:XisI protein